LEVSLKYIFYTFINSIVYGKEQYENYTGEKSS